MVSRFLLFDSFVRNRFEYSQIFLCGMGVSLGKRGWLDGDVFAMPPIKHIIPSMYDRFIESTTEDSERMNQTKSKVDIFGNPKL